MSRLHTLDQARECGDNSRADAIVCLVISELEENLGGLGHIVDVAFTEFVDEDGEHLDCGFFFFDFVCDD